MSWQIQQIFTIMVFLSLCLPSYGQNYDSLFRTILSTADDTAKVRALNDLGFQTRKTNASFAIEVTEKAIEIARIVRDTSGMMESEKILGIAYSYGREKDQAMEHFLKGLSLSRKLQNRAKEASILKHIGNLHFITSQFDVALSYYSQSLAIRREIKDLKGMASTLGNMGNIANAKLNDLDLAIKYYSESLEISRKLNNQELISTTYNNLGNIYRTRGNFEQALSSQKAAIAIELENKDFFGLTYTFSSIVMLYLDINNTDSAFHYASRLEHIADSLQSLSRRQVAYYRMSKVLEQKGDYKGALSYQRSYQEVKDSLKSTRTTRQLAEVNAKYANELQSREVAELRNQNLINEQKLENQFKERLIWALLTIILLGGLRLLWMRLKINKSKTEKLSHQKEKLTKESEEISRFNEIINKRNQELNETLKRLKQTQEKLLESEKVASIGILTSGLAHELNNPLNYVNGIIRPVKMNLGELSDAVEKGNKQETDLLITETNELLVSLTNGIDKITAIIKNLLDISPKIYPDQERAIELNKILESAVYGVQYNFPNVSFELEAKDEVVVYGDYAELNQVFINLLKNAVDAMAQTKYPKIHIALNQEDQVAKICISDNGCGMEKSTLKDIFQPFYTTKAPGKGTGLGLYISYGIIRKYDGKIEVASEPGKGTKFSISLPVSNKESVLK
ncbi:MAG: ATP-binding protein [Cyclobacteriaceae bacterium]